MPGSLVIVESPAKCKKIASFLGSTFTVVATMGHIRSLEETLEAVGIDRDFEPRFQFLSEKSKAMQGILNAAKKADTIYLAADDDREGEAIAYSVACLLKKDPLSLPRAVFHEITKTAVCDAVANPRRIDMNRVFAQQARAVLDMLVGFTVSPLLWKYVAKALSAGRCQTPALRLVSDREKEITTHTSETTWTLSGTFRSKSDSFQARMCDELEDQESALNYLENVHEDSGAVVTSKDVRPWTLNAPKPLITSTLQQEASALYKLNPKTTMKIAQSLYESGHITYMRTDHAILSEEAVKAAHEEVRKAYGPEYIGTAPKPSSKKASGQAQTQAQEAHEAIRPTHFELKELPSNEDWNPIDKKVYQLIWKRAIQSTMSSAYGKIHTLTLQLNADPSFPWATTWRTTEFQGWQLAGQVTQIDEPGDEEDSSKESSLPKVLESLTVGSKLTWTELQASPKRTKAPSRFTEATLIRELEKRGIGRPSTFASLVEVLFDKGYVEKKDISGAKINHTTMTLQPSHWPPLTQTTQITLGAEKQKLVPTALGDSVLSFVIQEFPQLFSYDFTASMESRLDKVSKGEEEWKQLCRDTWNSYKDSYARLKDKSSVPSNSDKVKDFGGGFKAVLSKKGALLVQETPNQKTMFYSFPPGLTIQTITEEQARHHIQELQKESILGTWNGTSIEKKKGPYGYYLQCGDVRIPYNESHTQQQILETFAARDKSRDGSSKGANGDKYIFGPYTFAKGQYGPYMYKHDLKTKIFVGIPDTLDPRRLTAEEADSLYKHGVEAKKAGGGRGGKGGKGGKRS